MSVSERSIPAAALHAETLEKERAASLEMLAVAREEASKLRAFCRQLAERIAERDHHQQQHQQQQQQQQPQPQPQLLQQPPQLEQRGQRRTPSRFDGASLSENGGLQRVPRAEAALWRTPASETKPEPEPEPEPEQEQEQEQGPLEGHEHPGRGLHDQLPRRQSPPRPASRSPERSQDLGRHGSTVPRKARGVPGGATMVSARQLTQKEWGDLT